MIPILYDTNETAFTSNGLCRLRDMIECRVTEERNGIYEADFQFPVDGANFEQIKVGRIIGVTHDETGDIQPFDIVSYSRPIGGVVTFHAVHISYRQSYLTATGSNINSLADAFTMLEGAEPDNPFAYETDKSTVAYMSAADGKPKSVKQLLGGIEGSILDTYGGEYEWDVFRVILHENRGQMRPFTIRYGVNMLEYNEDLDISGTYSSCVPFWTDGTTTVVGDRQDLPNPTPTGRGECIPLDVSDKFESQPTKAQVEAMGLSVLESKKPYNPTQNIKVKFARLQEIGELGNIAALYRCRLCDSIEVVFPSYNATGTFKIVKTVWNVLADRYDEMELGDLSLTLSQALGTTGGSTVSGGGGGGPTTVTVDVNSTTTGNPGTNASVTNVGDQVNVLLDFVIPRGADGTNGTNGQDGQDGAPGADGKDANIWTATAAPTAPNYTFNISDLTGGTGTPRVGDLVFYSYYRYTITSVASTTVQASNRQSLRGATGSTGTAAGFGTPTATIDANVGTPSVTVTASGSNTAKVFAFDFKNLKGEPGTNGTNGQDGTTFTPSVDAAGDISWTNDGGKTNPPTQNIKGPTGDAAGFGTPTASVDANTGTPSVTVSASGPDTAKVFDFAFHNLKGAKGDPGDVSDVQVNGSSVVSGGVANITMPVIVDSGTSGIWTYRKWSDGTAECWGTHSWTISSWTAWGGTYYSTYSGTINYPSGLFNATPTVVADGEASTGDCWLASRGGATYGGTKDHTASYFLMRASNGTNNITGYINIHAIGKWQ